MKLKSLFSVLLFSFFMIINSPANAKKNLYPEFTELLQQYHEISSSLQVDMLQSVYLIKESIKTEPNVKAIKASAISINKKVKKFEEISLGIKTFLDSNKTALAKSKKVIKKIKADTSQEIVSQIKTFSNAFKDFSDDLQEVEFTIYGNEGWANSGIAVNPNDGIWVDSHGGWTVSPSYEMVGWEGYTCKSSKMYNINKKAHMGALIYRVRGSSNPNGYPLSLNKRGRIDSRGRLEFIINDSDRRNNSGQLDLKVVVFNGDLLGKLFKAIQNFQEENKQKD